MIHRSTRIAIEVVLGVLAVAVLLIGVAFWRLTTGPVELDFLTPEIEAAFAQPDKGVSVEVGRTVLTWAGWRRTVDLHAKDVRLRDRDGVVVAALPDIIVRLSLRALVQGTIAATAVEVVGARVTIERDAEGRFRIGRWTAPGDGSDTGPKADLTAALPRILEELMAPPKAGHPLSFLQAVRIVEGEVLLYDYRLSRVIEAPRADIELRRDKAGLAGEAALTVALGKERTDVTAGFLYERDSGQISFSADFVDLQPPALASFAAALEPLAGLTTPLAGSVVGSLSPDATLDSLRLTLHGAAGTLTLPGILAGPLDIRNLRASARLDRPAHTLELESATIQLGTDNQPGPEITAQATLKAPQGRFDGDLEIGVTGEARAIDMARLGRYWPIGLGANARAWVLENIPKGTTDSATVSAQVDVPAGRWADADVRQAAGRLKFHGLEVHYLRPMPPVTEVGGTGEFDQEGMQLTAERGSLGALEVRPSTVDMTGFSKPNGQRMAIDLAVVGPLRAALETLDHDRLKLIRRLGLDPADTEGQMAARVNFEFPLLKVLALEHIGISARANLENVSIKDVLFGKSATEGKLALEVDKSGMRLEGPIKLAGIATDFTWTESFAHDAKRVRVIDARVARLDAVDRARLGFDLAPYVEGPISLALHAFTDQSGETEVKSAINLQKADLAVSRLLWEKPAGVPGEARVALRLVGSRPQLLERIDVNAGSLHAVGRGRFDEAGHSITGLDFETLAFNATKLRDVEFKLDQPQFDLTVGGGVLDIAPFWSLPDVRADGGAEAAQTDTQRTTESAGAGRPAGEREVFTPLRLRAKSLDAVYFAEDRYLEKVSLDLRRAPEGWQRIWIDGRVPESLWHAHRADGTEVPTAPATAPDAAKSVPRQAGKPEPKAPEPEAAEPQGPEPRAAASDGNSEAAPVAAKPPEKTVNIDFHPVDEGGYSLSVTAEDMGAVLRALDILDTVSGGRLEIVGRSHGALPHGPLNAHLEAQDYLLVQAPILARLLTVASLTGIYDLLQGEGIRFQRLTGDFALQDGVVTTDLMRAYGAALGLTMKGRIDFEALQSDLEGTLVPAYAVNRILGQIPLLGPLLTGGEGEGFLAVTYRIKGPLGDPKVSVNPLSALAPGFLRGLFGLFEGGTPSEEDRPTVFPKGAQR